MDPAKFFDVRNFPQRPARRAYHAIEGFRNFLAYTERNRAALPLDSDSCDSRPQRGSDRGAQTGLKPLGMALHIDLSHPTGVWISWNNLSPYDGAMFSSLNSQPAPHPQYFSIRPSIAFGKKSGPRTGVHRQSLLVFASIHAPILTQISRFDA